MNLALRTEHSGVARVSPCRLSFSGLLPVATRLVYRMILADDASVPRGPRSQTVVAVRVSSGDQKFHIEGQVERVTAWAITPKIVIDKAVIQVASACRGQGREFGALLRDPLDSDRSLLRSMPRRRSDGEV